ncbi:UNVERIFIED_CONTAM: hypothetical protein HDU68_008183 [Siphonaria sp. JEL0065]|nr:hypothetical protein HDU68_008183 [Siphonaria sp. JEL0065]
MSSLYLLLVLPTTLACYYDYNNDGAWNNVRNTQPGVWASFNVNIPGQTNTAATCGFMGKAALHRCDALYSPNMNGGVFFNNDGNIVVWSFAGTGGHLLPPSVDAAAAEIVPVEGKQPSNETMPVPLERRFAGIQLWATGTGGTDADTFMLKYNSDLVVTGPGVINGNQARWNAGVGGYGNGWLCFSQNGDLIVGGFNGNWYTIWHTNTIWTP